MKLEEEIAKKFPLIITEEDVKYHIMNHLGYLKDFVKSIVIKKYMNASNLYADVELYEDIEEDLYDKYDFPYMTEWDDIDRNIITYDLDKFYTIHFKTPFEIHVHFWDTERIILHKQQDLIFNIDYLKLCQIVQSKLRKFHIWRDTDIAFLCRSGISECAIILYCKSDSSIMNIYQDNPIKSNLKKFLDKYLFRKLEDVDLDDSVAFYGDLQNILYDEYGKMELNAVADQYERLQYVEIKISGMIGQNPHMKELLDFIEPKYYQREDVTSSLSTIKDIVKLINNYKETEDERKDQLITTQSGITQFDN